MLIATHDGSFHADETLACAIISYVHERCEVIRSRNPVELEKADIVIDVSGINDDKHFDHHSNNFNLKRDNGINYATAGLMWQKFGFEYLRKIAQIGRSVGLHLILITQRPDREIIKGSIHNNFGSRIALKMSSIHDSKTILENKDYDASCLQGRGHMICKLNNVGGDGYCFAQAGFISNIDELLAALTRDYSA